MKAVENRQFWTAAGICLGRNSFEFHTLRPSATKCNGSPVASAVTFNTSRNVKHRSSPWHTVMFGGPCGHSCGRGHRHVIEPTAMGRTSPLETTGTGQTCCSNGSAERLNFAGRCSKAWGSFRDLGISVWGVSRPASCPWCRRRERSRRCGGRYA